MPTRRTFIKNSGLLGAALIFNNDLLFAGKKNRIGLQMYTMRNVIDSKNVAQVLARIAVIGYKELEIFGYTARDKFWGLDPIPFKALLKSHGLTAPSAHISFENFLTGKDESEFRFTCETAAIVGNKFIVVPWLAENYRKHGDDYKLLAGRLNKAAIIARQYGLQLLYHNHDFEFTPLENGATGYDLILQHTDKELVNFELDLYWTVKAGKDPLQLFRDHPGRFPLWHVKDMDKATRSFTEAGTGIINFKEIFQQKKLAGLRHFFIEQDEVKKDVFESIKQSFDFAKNNLLI